jgi:hypothetical protein
MKIIKLPTKKMEKQLQKLLMDDKNCIPIEEALARVKRKKK